MNCSTPGLPVHHQLPEFTQTHVHRVGDAIQPSHSLLSPSPPAPNPPSIRVFSNESTLHRRWPNYWSFSFSISPSNEYPGLISFRMDWLDLLAGQGILKSLLQHHSSKASVLHSSAFMVQLFATPWIAAHQASLFITNSWSSPKLMCIESVMPSSHLILCRPFSSCPQSLPASGSFPMSQLFAWGGQSIGVSASASVLPMNTQAWSPLGWTGWISLQSKGLSRVFSNTTVQKHQFFGTQLS